MSDNDNVPATRADINTVRGEISELRSEVRGEISELRSEVRAEIGELRTELRSGLERVETNLLTAFHQWAQTYEIRARGTTAAVNEFDQRLGLIEERLSRLERERHQ